jgi:hypothetical protein
MILRAAAERLWRRRRPAASSPLSMTPPPMRTSHTTCVLGAEFYCPNYHYFTDYTEASGYPPGIARFGTCLLTAWTCGAYMSKIFPGTILNPRSSCCESFFHLSGTVRHAEPIFKHESSTDKSENLQLTGERRRGATSRSTRARRTAAAARARRRRGGRAGRH